MAKFEPIAIRFWRYVTHREAEGCWLWAGCRNKKGYGALSVNNRPKGAHVVSWELHFGPVPELMQVLHSCDVPACVRPAHLYLGSAADNSADMIAKRRHSAYAGENTQAKLTRTQVKAMREEYHRLVEKFAKAFGVGEPCIRHVLSGRTWK